MPHQTEHRETEDLKNGQVCIHIFCCGEHEYRYTLSPEVEDIEASVKEAHGKAAKEHERVKRLRETVKQMEGSKVTHGDN